MKQIFTKMKAIILDKTSPGQFVKYVVTGFICFITEIALLYLGKELFNLWYIFANSIAVLVVFWLNFLLNRFWTFKSKYNFYKQVLRYGILFVIDLALSNLFMFLFTDVLKIYYLFSKVFAIGLEVTWNFVLYKKVIYK